MQQKEETCAHTHRHCADHSAITLSIQADPSDTKCWYIVSILSSILCCWLCGLIGLIHVMIGRQEGERGNMKAYRERLHQGKCWTSWSIAVGTLIIIVYIVLWIFVDSKKSADPTRMQYGGGHLAG